MPGTCGNLHAIIKGVDRSTSYPFGCQPSNLGQSIVDLVLGLKDDADIAYMIRHLDKINVSRGAPMCRKRLSLKLTQHKTKWIEEVQPDPNTELKECYSKFASEPPVANKLWTYEWSSLLPQAAAVLSAMKSGEVEHPFTSSIPSIHMCSNFLLLELWQRMRTTRQGLGFNTSEFK